MVHVRRHRASPPATGCGPGRCTSRRRRSSATWPSARPPSTPASRSPSRRIAELAADKLAVKAGGAVFTRNCVKCHGARGEGNIGPNLTDEFWIAGGSALDIYQTILHGRDGKGMPSWGLVLGTGACKQLAAYVVTIRGSNLPGKAPQGERRPDPAPAK